MRSSVPCNLHHREEELVEEVASGSKHGSTAARGALCCGDGAVDSQRNALDSISQFLLTSQPYFHSMSRILLWSSMASTWHHQEALPRTKSKMAPSPSPRMVSPCHGPQSLLLDPNPPSPFRSLPSPVSPDGRSDCNPANAGYRSATNASYYPKGDAQGLRTATRSISTRHSCIQFHFAHSCPG